MKTEFLYETGEDGLVSGVSYHDGNIIAFSINGDVGSIQIKNLNDVVFEFELRGLDDWSLEFWKMPIVNDVSIWNVGFASQESYGWKALFGARVSPQNINKVIEKTRRKIPESYLFHIDCSYGGYMAAVCSDISVYRLENT